MRVFCLKTIAFVILIIQISSQTQQTWASTVSTVTMHPTFICQASLSQIIAGNITVPLGKSYIISLYRPNEYYPSQTPYQLMTLTNSANFTFNPVDQAGYWRVEVLPQKSSDVFLFTITLSIGNTVNNYVDVARNRKLFVLYISAG